MLYIPMSLKRCNKCDEWKLATSLLFRPNRKGLLLRADCIACEREHYRSYYQKAREEILRRKQLQWKHATDDARQKARQRASEHWAHMSEGDKEIHRLKCRAYYRSHRDKILLKHKEQWAMRDDRQREERRVREARRRSTYRFHIRAMRRQWYRTESGRLRNRGYAAKRRALRLASSNAFTKADVERQYEAQDGRCYYCETEVGHKYHVDHYIPLLKGGSNDAENIVIACPACNMSKGSKMPDEFLAKLKRKKGGL